MIEPKQDDRPRESSGPGALSAALAAVFTALGVLLAWSPAGIAGAGLNRQEEKNLTERLGYPRDAKLLIVHADDIGMAHSVNAATTRAFEIGAVNSGSIMIPCPWLPEVAAYAKSHPEADLGLHLTLTSEWTGYRWGGVLRDRAPTLFDPSGYLYPTEAQAAAHIDPREAEAEIRAQVERARALGIQPTHLDSHMGTLFQTRPLYEALLRAGRDYKLPVLVSKDWFGRADYLKSSLGPGDITIDHMVTISPIVPPGQWAAFYSDAIKNLSPGVTEIIIHLAYDDEEMRAATADHPGWGAAWRQRDYDFFTSTVCRELLEENKIKLVTWREIGKLLR